MKFKIKHEVKMIQYFSVAAVFPIFMLLVNILVLRPDDILLIDAVVILLFGTLSLFFVEQAVGTMLIIEDGYVIIKHLLFRKKIKIADIIDLRIEPYSRRRKQGRYSRYTEWRMKMTICVINKKDTVLTDTATMVNGALGFLLSSHEKCPDEEVPLYKAYQVICSLRQ